MDRPVIGERIARPDRGLGLHQGSPLSPLLCNLYLDGFDRAMLSCGYRAIRYSDDIAIPVPDRGAAERVLSDAARELTALRLNLDPVKARWCPSTPACRSSGRW
jgi:CRISPR-associated protein Cas1